MLKSGMLLGHTANALLPLLGFLATDSHSVG